MCSTNCRALGSPWRWMWAGVTGATTSVTLTGYDFGAINSVAYAGGGVFYACDNTVGDLLSITADGEGDVSRHRDTPAPSSRIVAQEEVEGRRYHNATEGGNGRQGRFPWIA